MNSIQNDLIIENTIAAPIQLDTQSGGSAEHDLVVLNDFELTMAAGGTAVVNMG